mgnify:CR=1 FL=1|jgi:Lon protease-like protein
MTTLPMFPLEHVLLPGEPLQLNIFEPRYRALVADILDDGRRFGVVLITRGSEVGGDDERSDVGTVAQVLAHRELPDGRFQLACTGADRFRVTRWLPDDPYPLAEVELWPDGPAGTAEQWDRALVRFAERFEPVEEWFAEAARRDGRPHSGIIGPPADAEPGEYTFGKTTALPLPELDRYRILSAPDPITRIDVMLAALDDVEPLLRDVLRPDD